MIRAYWTLTVRDKAFSCDYYLVNMLSEKKDEITIEVSKEVYDEVEKGDKFVLSLEKGVK